MKPIAIHQSASVDYSKNDFSKLLVMYICVFSLAAIIVQIDRSNRLAALYNIESNNLNFYLVLIAVALVGLYEGFLYFRKYRFQIRNSFSERKIINIVWLIMPLSIIILFIEQTDMTSILPDFSKFLFALSVFLIIKYHFSLS